MVTETEERDPWWVAEDTDEWVASDEPGVYFRTPKDGTGMSGYGPDNAVANGRAIRERFGDDVTVVITVGPYRMYDVKFRASNEDRRVHLDYYSVYAGTHRIDEVIADMADGGFEKR